MPWSKMVEFEKTYLLKFIPDDLKNCKSVEIFDYYIPKSEFHPVIRIRKRGDAYEITKKTPTPENNSAIQLEQTILLSKTEYDELIKLDGKVLRKYRYFYPCEIDGREYTSEIDVYLDTLEGLVTADFEFKNEEQLIEFKMPDFCSDDVTDEEFIASGFLAGRTYGDIEKDLEKYNYKKLHFFK